MKAYTSDKIRILSFLSIVLVVFLHAFNLNNLATTKPLFYKSWIWFVQDIVSYGFTRIAVPLFFLLSSYLFFLNTHGSLADFIGKMKKRIHTLLIPFLFWSFFGIFFYFTLQSLPQTAKFFTKGHVVDFTAGQWLQTIFINPIPYQLWFVRDLMVLIVLSPLLYQGIKQAWKLMLALAFIGWILAPNVWQNSSEALLFFVIGASLSVHQPKRIETNYARFSLGWMLFWMLLVLLKTALQFASVPPELIFGIFKLSILVGLFACWSFYDRLFTSTPITNKTLLKLSAFTFFIYASHEPVLTVFKKILFVILGKTAMGHFEIYLAAPILTLLFCLIMGYFLKRFATPVYAFLTGGR